MQERMKLICCWLTNNVFLIWFLCVFIFNWLYYSGRRFRDVRKFRKCLWRSLWWSVRWSEHARCFYTKSFLFEIVQIPIFTDGNSLLQRLKKIKRLVGESFLFQRYCCQPPPVFCNECQVANTWARLICWVLELQLGACSVLLSPMVLLQIPPVRSTQ